MADLGNIIKGKYKREYKTKAELKIEEQRGKRKEPFVIKNDSFFCLKCRKDKVGETSYYWPSRNWPKGPETYDNVYKLCEACLFEHQKEAKDKKQREHPPV
jgi:hypothetical protein